MTMKTMRRCSVPENDFSHLQSTAKPSVASPKPRLLLSTRLAVALFLLNMARTVARALTMKATLSTPPPRQSCAIIGGGVAGLRCAQVLSQKYDVTVFDTGRLRPGGRCASRFPNDDRPDADDTGRHDNYLYLSQCPVVDHAAQMITVPVAATSHVPTLFDSFAQQVQTWQDQGVLTRFPPGSLFKVRKSSTEQRGPQLVEFPLDQTPAYFGTQGMASIPLEMTKSKAFDVVQDVWVSPSNGVRYLKNSQQWKVQAKGQTLGKFDQLVIAHNGKCADRLMSKTPAKAVHQLLRVNFASSVPKHGGKRMTLNSVYSLTFALDSNKEASSPLQGALPGTCVGAFIENEPNLRYLTCQSRKYRHHHRHTSSSDKVDDNKGVEVWTLLSSAPFAKKHKAPQEFLPDQVVQNVTTVMLTSLEKSLDLAENSLQGQCLESRLQLWGAAVPLNTWENDDCAFLYDAENKVGVCGDWLCHSSIGGAWTSGEQLAQYMNKDNPQTAGLDGRFRRCEETLKNGIGSFDEKASTLLVSNKQR